MIATPDVPAFIYIGIVISRRQAPRCLVTVVEPKLPASTAETLFCGHLANYSFFLAPCVALLYQCAMMGVAEQLTLSRVV